MSRNLIIKKNKCFLSFHQLRPTDLDGKRERRRGPLAGMTAEAKHHLRHYSTKSISQKTHMLTSGTRLFKATPLAHLICGFVRLVSPPTHRDRH